MLVALPAEHALAGKPALALADLRDQDWVQTSATSPCARHVVRSCLAAGFEPKVTFESDDYETVQGLVAAGVGVALIPHLALTHVHPGIVVRALAPAAPDAACRRGDDRRSRGLTGRRHDDRDPGRRRQAVHRAAGTGRLGVDRRFSSAWSSPTDAWSACPRLSHAQSR